MITPAIGEKLAAITGRESRGKVIGSFPEENFYSSGKDLKCDTVITPTTGEIPIKRNLNPASHHLYCNLLKLTAIAGRVKTEVN